MQKKSIRDANYTLLYRLSSSVSPLLAIDIAIAAQNGANGQHGMRVRDYVPNNAAQGALDHLVNWANEQQKQKTLCQYTCVLRMRSCA